jgi:cyclic pyranopterin phosphate synthase
LRKIVRRQATGVRRTTVKTKKELTHFDEAGAAWMVDVSAKGRTAREAVAGARVDMLPATFRLITDRKAAKGDVLGVARVAGIMAAKRTATLIPLCHPIGISAIEIAFEPDPRTSSVGIRATVRTTDRTGVEMEALTAAAVAGLTIYDMCKAVDRAMTVSGIRLLKKTGGRSGTFIRK